MSFFKKLADDFDGLGLGDKRRDDERYSSSRDYPAPQHYGGGPSQTDYPSYPSPGSHHPPPPPSGSGYASSRDGPSGYGGAPPPSSSYSEASPSYNPPSDKPRIPSGWSPQWDAHYERWYYVEQATGRAQWEAPGYSPPAQDHDARGYPSEHSGGYGSSSGGGGGGYYGEQGYGHGDGGGGGEVYSEKKSSSSGMLLGAAGGLAVGAIGGALLHEALEDSDDEHRAAAPSYDEPPAVLPTHDAYGDEVDSSDRESVQEAREDYEEALADAQDSDASSSDQEELEEAREEYQEEYEEAYYDD